MAACLAFSPPLFFPPNFCLPQKETKRGSINVLRIYVKYHAENDLIPRFPSFALNFFKTTNSSDYQSPGFLIRAHFAPRRKKLYVVERPGPEYSFKRGMVLDALMMYLVLSFQKPVF